MNKYEQITQRIEAVHGAAHWCMENGNKPMSAMWLAHEYQLTKKRGEMTPAQANFPAGTKAVTLRTPRISMSTIIWRTLTGLGVVQAFLLSFWLFGARRFDELWIAFLPIEVVAFSAGCFAVWLFWRMGYGSGRK